MTVFKGYMQIAKKNIKTIIIYMVIFFALVIMMQMVTKETGDKTFSAAKMNIAVVDIDKSELSSAMISYLKKEHNVTKEKNDKSLLQESLYYGRYDLVVTFQKDFEKKTIEGKKAIRYTKGDTTYGGMYVKQQLNLTLANVMQYYAAGYSIQESLDKVTGQKAGNVEILDVNGYGGQIPDFSRYFAYLPYLFTAALCEILGVVLIAFREDEVRKRMTASATSLFRQNIEGILAFLCIGITFFCISFVVAIGMFGNDMLGASSLGYYVINGLLAMLTAVAIGFVIGMLLKRQEHINAVVVPVSLCFAFIGGVFVPLSMLSEQIKRVARFVPTYWYSTVNDTLVRNKEITGEVYDKIMQAYGIQVLFILIILGVGLVIGKYKQQDH